MNAPNRVIPIPDAVRRDAWLVRLQDHLKGDTWEVEIMVQTLSELRTQINAVRDDLLKACK